MHDVRDVLARLVVDEVDEVQLLFTVDVVYLKKPSKIAWGNGAKQVSSSVRAPPLHRSKSAGAAVAVLDNSKKRVFARTQCFLFLLIRWGVATGRTWQRLGACVFFLIPNLSQ